MFLKVFESCKNSFQWPARDIDYQCSGSQQHICCVQVVSGGKKTPVQLNSENFSVLAAHSGSASTAAELDALDSGSLILSFPFLNRTPTAASQLLHSIKQLSDRWVQPGFRLQSIAHIYEVPPKSACCSRTFTKCPRIVVLMAGDVSRSHAQLVFAVKAWLMDHSLLTDCERGQSLQLCLCSCLWTHS